MYNFKELINIESCINNKYTLRQRINNYKDKDTIIKDNLPITDTGLESTGLESTGLESTGLESTGLESTVLESTGLESKELESTGLESKIDIVGNKKFITTYDIDDLGRNIKNVKEYNMEKRTINIPKNVAKRRKMTKFGVSAGLPPGPDDASTTLVCEDVFFEFTRANKVIDDSEPNNGIGSGSINNIFSAVGGSGKAVKCRYCDGNHWSMKCTNKDSAIIGTSIESTKGKSKYMPPSMRNGNGNSGDIDGIKRQRDENTIRVSNISENATENDIRDLFIRYGYIKRLFYKNEKGFAFITYDTMESCEDAVIGVNRHLYDYLVLSVEIAKSK
jgi:translation initiation factor 3 subunit G